MRKILSNCLTFLPFHETIGFVVIGWTAKVQRHVSWIPAETGVPAAKCHAVVLLAAENVRGFTKI